VSFKLIRIGSVERYLAEVMLFAVALLGARWGVGMVLSPFEA
jgi:hypothetical protein